MKVSVVLPCLNESEAIADCINNAKKFCNSLGIAYEIIVADNNSTDNSVSIAKQNGAMVVIINNRGYGSALHGGIMAADGDIIVIADADGTYDFLDATPMVQKILAGEADFVIGSRIRGSIHHGAMPWSHRYIGTPALSLLLNALYRGNFSDVNCGLRAFTIEMYKKMDMQSSGMEYASEMLIKALKINAEIAEVPISLYPDKRNRKPHLRPFHDGVRHVNTMITMYK